MLCRGGAEVLASRSRENTTPPCEVNLSGSHVRPCLDALGEACLTMSQMPWGGMFDHALDALGEACSPMSYMPYGGMFSAVNSQWERGWDSRGDFPGRTIKSTRLRATDSLSHVSS